MAALREGIENLPSTHIDEKAPQIKLLLGHRENLVRQRTQNQNRLRDGVHQLWPEFQIPISGLEREKWLDQIARKLSRCSKPVQARIAKQQLAQIRADTKMIAKLTAESLRSTVR